MKTVSLPVLEHQSHQVYHENLFAVVIFFFFCPCFISQLLKKLSWEVKVMTKKNLPRCRISVPKRSDSGRKHKRTRARPAKKRRLEPKFRPSLITFNRSTFIHSNTLKVTATLTLAMSTRLDSFPHFLLAFFFLFERAKSQL